MRDETSPFSMFRYLTHSKKKWEHLSEVESKAYDPFMTNRIVSMLPECMPLACAINRGSLSKKSNFEFYYNALPSIFFKVNYIRKGKTENIDKQEIECIKKYWDVSEREALEYREMLSDDEVETICKKFESGKKK